MVGTSSRILTLLSLWQSRRDWPGPVLADRLEVGPRTVRRDVDRLRELGYVITADRHVYRLDRTTPKVPAGAPSTRRPIPTGDARSCLAARSKGSHGVDVWPCYGEVLLELPSRDIVPAPPAKDDPDDPLHPTGTAHPGRRRRMAGVAGP